MENKLLKAIEEYSLIEKGDRIVVALSGGADSAALLYSLLALKEKLSLTVYACHINHLLRGEESFRDESFVKKLCKKNSVELFLLRCDINKLASEKQIGSEECGRQVRYDFLQENAKRLGAKIATAHTSTDSMETVIMNMSRGCGVKGAKGIPPKRGNIIRPLILATRRDTENYCISNNIPYVNDSTNEERIYTRNKVRLDIIPVLREINPSIEQAFTRFSRNMYELDYFIDKMAEDAIASSKVLGGYSCEKLLTLPKPVLSRAVEIICNNVGGELESIHIELIERAIEKGRSVSVKNGFEADARQGIFRVYRTENDKISEYSSEFPVIVGETIIICNKNVNAKLMNVEDFNKQFKIDKNIFQISLDYDTISDTAVFRSRRSGDLMSPKGRKLTKPLRKLMSEMKLPAEKRDSLVILADNNNVIWAEGIGTAEKHTVSPTTKRVLVINILQSEVS